MGELRGQVWEVRAGDQVFEGLDVRAIARWPKSGESPTVDVVINHAGPVLLGFLEAREERVSILAGYADDQGVVEIGGGRVVEDSVEEDRSSVDRPVEFQLSNRKATDEVVLSASWASVAASEVLEYIRGEAGLAGDIRLGSDLQYTRYSIDGGFASVLEDLAGDTGSDWEVDGATLRMWPSAEEYQTTADLWSPSTGLMRVSGADKEIRAAALLRPALRPGDAIRIVDDGYQGDLRLTEVTHEIDTYGGMWMTTVTGRPL